MNFSIEYAMVFVGRVVKTKMLTSHKGRRESVSVVRKVNAREGFLLFLIKLWPTPRCQMDTLSRDIIIIIVNIIIIPFVALLFYLSSALFVWIPQHKRQHSYIIGI